MVLWKTLAGLAVFVRVEFVDVVSDATAHVEDRLCLGVGFEIGAVVGIGGASVIRGAGSLRGRRW